ncbi:MAG: hypothetical protein H5T45_07435 [Thermoplasmatales archaeon]|nr:hypothetical protein [Thermoplasmatales archaeon]
MEDKISKAALKLITSAEEPLETKEIEEKVNKIIEDKTRTKLFYRLNNFRRKNQSKENLLVLAEVYRIDGRKGIFEK